MRGESRRAARDVRVRRARREDIGALVDCVGGPPPGRVRALRRLLKTLAADVYVLDRSGSLDGLVAIHYRRSLTHGGMLATIDALMPLGAAEDTRREDLGRLVECALTRARRRGCVAIDSCIASADARTVLSENQFDVGPTQLGRSLRSEEEEG